MVAILDGIDHDLIEIGKEYHLDGMIENGYIDGKPFICQERVTRKIVSVRDGKIRCVCGRVFIADATKVSRVKYEKYDKEIAIRYELIMSDTKEVIRQSSSLREIIEQYREFKNYGRNVFIVGTVVP